MKSSILLLPLLLCLSSAPWCSADAENTAAAAAAPRHPLPQGFDGVDERVRAPAGFAQNQQENRIKLLKENALDGDYAVLTGTLTAQLDDKCYEFTDHDGDSARLCLTAPLPRDLEDSLQLGKHYQIWTQVETGLLQDFTLHLLMFSPQL